MRLVQAGVDYQLRELFESSLAFSGAVLRELGFDDIEIAETIEDVRDRDAERFEMQLAGGIEAGRALWRNNTTTPQPEPFTRPRRGAQVRGRFPPTVTIDDIALVSAMAAAAAVLIYLTCRALGWAAAAIVLARNNR